MGTAEKSRDYLFDNYKVLLIFLVVVGHFAGPSVPDNEFLRILKWFIVSFHMPAFIFVSGYFGKKDLPLLTIIQKLAVPYLVYEVIYYFWYTLLLHKETGLYLTKPKFTLWYLLALFLWRVITPYVRKIPHHMVLAILAGILIGFSNMEDNFLTIPRAVVFYPFYLAGTAFDRETLTKLRTGKGKQISTLCIVIILVFLTFLGLRRIAPMQIFYGRYNYAFMKQGILEGVLWRIAMYLIGFAMTFSVMILMSEKKFSLSCIGKRTMAIYLFHGLTYTYLENCTTVLENRNTLEETVLLLAACVGLTYIFSLKPFTSFTNSISNLRLPIFSSKN